MVQDQILWLDVSVDDLVLVEEPDSAYQAADEEFCLFLLKQF